MKKMFKSFIVIFICIFSTAVAAKNTDKALDKHYNEVGFFDLHYCNWPDRKPFIMALFSTVHYKDVKSIEIFSPQGTLIDNLDLTKFRSFTTKDKKLKKVFIKQIPVDQTFKDGWYKSITTMRNGKQVTAYDYVKYTLMGIVKQTIPKNKSEDNDIPTVISWNKLNGAKHYQVFIKDLWQDGKQIYTSKLLDTNQLKLPKKLLEPGGYYSWRIHARDINEDPILGDFNHGSLSDTFSFTIKD